MLGIQHLPILFPILSFCLPPNVNSHNHTGSVWIIWDNPHLSIIIPDSYKAAFVVEGEALTGSQDLEVDSYRGLYPAYHRTKNLSIKT